MKKDYKPETLFIAAGILDRYLYMVGAQNFPKAQMVSLATICVLMAAKMEQPISPSFNRLIGMLTAEEQKYVSKQGLIDLEEHVLMMLGFDFNFPGPIQSMDRFIRILSYDKNKTIREMSYQICKFQLNEAKFLNFRPSCIAACSVILSINIYQKIEEQSNPTGFFAGCKTTNGLIEMNTEIWNNNSVHQVTGYSIEDIQECLFDLS